MLGLMTGRFTGVATKDTRGGIHNSLSRSIDLAKLNQNCHMNYSIIFTEISFSPETSSLTKYFHLQGRLLDINKLETC